MAPFSEETGFYVIRLVLLILGICGTILNITCITILLSIKGTLRTQLKLLLSLAVSDCVIDIIHIIKASIGSVGTLWVFLMDITGATGMFRFTLSVLFITVQWTSLLTMMSLAVDLLLRVRRPLRYSHLMSKKRGNILITCIWTLCCIFSFGLSEIFAILGNRFVFAIQYIVLHGVILLSFFAFYVLYACILCGVRSRTRTTRHGPRSRALRRTAVTSALILVSYLVCLMPEIWILTFEAAGRYKFQDSQMFIRGLECLFLLNTIIDPIIFVTRVPEVRNRFKTLTQCLRRQRVSIASEQMGTARINVSNPLPGQSNLRCLQVRRVSVVLEQIDTDAKNNVSNTGQSNTTTDL